MTAARISTLRKIGLTLGLALSISTVATSSSFAYSARAQQMCMGDALRLCSSEIPSIARITACMRRNKANVSRGCRAVIEEEEAKLTRTKPVQAAPAEQKPAAASRVEQPAAPKTKPVQAAPVEQKPVAAPPVEQPAATGTKPVQARARRAKTGHRNARRTTRSDRDEARSGCARRAKTGHRNARRTTRSDRDEARSGCARRANTGHRNARRTTRSHGDETRSGCALEQRPAIATPVEVKPVQAKPAPGGKPVKLAQRKRTHRRLAVEPHILHEFRNVHRTIGFTLPIPFVILFYW